MAQMDTDFYHADEFSLNTNRSNITNLPCGCVFYSPTDSTDGHRFGIFKVALTKTIKTPDSIFKKPLALHSLL